MANQLRDFHTIIDNPTSPESQAVIDRFAQANALKAARAHLKADRMAMDCVGKAFKVKDDRGTYHGVISRCERAGVIGKYNAFKVWLKCGEYVNGPFTVTALPR